MVVAHDFASESWVAGSGSVVANALSGLSFMPFILVANAPFELEFGGHSVEDLNSVIFEVLAVRDGIDKTGSDDESGCVDNLAPFDWGFADGDDSTFLDANEPDRIKFSFGVNDSSVCDDGIVLGVNGWHESKAGAGEGGSGSGKEIASRKVHASEFT